MFDLVVMNGEAEHLVPVGFKQMCFVGKRMIFAADVLIVVVAKKDFHLLAFAIRSR